MGSLDRSKKRIQLWKKAALHFLLCFVMGFFTGFAPTSTASLFSGQTVSYHPVNDYHVYAKPVGDLKKMVEVEVEHGNVNRSLISELKIETSTTTIEEDQLIIIITTTRSGNPLQGPFLTRLANTLRLAPPPLLWIVVEAHNDMPKTAELLRDTGIMYRHLTFKENFTDHPEAELDHQRNVALNHIEYHRLNGIVHFAGMADTYDLDLFDEIRDIEVFGAWSLAMVSSNRQQVVVEGPVCRSEKVVGWQRKEVTNGTSDRTDTAEANYGTAKERPSSINISSFAFNSSILWDPERWGRASSVPDTSQDSIKFVQRVVLEDEAKLRPIPPDCSRIMAWQLHLSQGQNYVNQEIVTQSNVVYHT